mmetsp:Transcript_9455/g.26984  ORF Transcript_9455/g.26984 Transcript_9455/m.26984 type:complete len:167 (+) Transcript_9455:147-647(+)
MYRPRRTSEVVEASERPLPEVKLWLSIILFVLSCSTAVGLAFAIHERMPYDPLRQPVVASRYIHLDLWSFVHLAVYVCVGFVLPEAPLTCMAYAALWEFQKHALALHSHEFSRVWKEKPVNMFWDFWVSVVGYRIGEMLMIQCALWSKRRRIRAEAKKRAAAKKRS